MIEELTATQIAARIGVSERTAQRYLRDGKIPCTQLSHNRYAVQNEDLERLKLPASHIETVAYIEQVDRRLNMKIDAIANNFDTRIAQLEAQIGMLTAMLQTEQKKKTQARSKVPILHVESVNALPNDLVVWRSFARLHGIAETTVATAIKDEVLPVVHGRWLVGRVWVEQALNEHGRATFYQLYAHSERFKPCDECPHHER